MIGQHIVEYEQKGHEKADYGSGLLDQLSEDLSRQYGNGFGRSNVFCMRRFYLLYPKIQTVSGFLSWSHYVELLKIDDPQERAFYEREAETGRWGVRELKRLRKGSGNRPVGCPGTETADEKHALSQARPER